MGSKTQQAHRRLAEVMSEEELEALSPTPTEAEARAKTHPPDSAPAWAA